MEGNRVELVPLAEIEPLRVTRPADLKTCLALLRAGKKPSHPVWVHQIKQPHKYRWRIVDGTHRVAAARLAGHSHIMARICVGLHAREHGPNGLREVLYPE